MKPHILVIQSQAERLDAFTTVLSDKYRLSNIEDITQALATRTYDTCQVIVFDAGMITDVEIAALRQLKSCDRLERPIILLTTQSTFDIEKKIAVIGVFYLLIRPFPSEDLIALLDAAVKYRHRTFGWSEGTNGVLTPSPARERPV